MEDSGVFGKHPGFGDFIAHGVPPSLREPLQTWLDGALSAAQQAHPETWKGTLANARPLRFWLGPSIVGRCLRGVMLASHDKVGRVYPLLGLQADRHAVPPPLMRDLAPFDALEAHVAGLVPRDLETAAQLGPQAGLSAAPDPGQDALWAVNPDAAPIELLQAIGSADYTRAAQARSYWWRAPDDVASGAVWSCSGLPDAEALVWLLSGVARGAAQARAQEEGQDVQQTMTGDDGS